MKKETKEKDCDRYIDRPFNIRPMCFWAFFTALTIIVCYWATSMDSLWIVAVYFTALITCFFVLQSLKTKDKVLIFFGSSRLFFCGLVILCLAAAVSFAFTSMAYTNQKSFAGYKILSGVVENYVMREDGSGYFMLADAKFGGTALGGYVMVYTEGVSFEFTTFDKVSLETQLRKAEANDYYVNNGIKYTANIRARDTVTVTGSDKGVRSSIMRYSRDFFGQFLSEENAVLMYSMLFGDQSGLDGEIKNDFRLTGLAHALAVSGLHVVLIIGLLMFLLNALKVSKKRQLYIIFSVLLIYCFLCGFRYSILRASIMFLVFTVRRAYLRSTDMLSSLSLAAIIILVLFPFSIYSVSFQLSFACMFGIALFYMPLFNYFQKVFKVKWLSTSLSMYCVTTITCLPIFIKYFGMVSVVGIAANVLVLPFIVLAFQASVVAIVTWVAGPVLYLLNPILDLTLDFTAFLAKLPLASVYVSGSGDWFLLYLVGVIFTTRFIFMRRRHKYTVAAALITVYLFGAILF